MTETAFPAGTAKVVARAVLPKRARHWIHEVWAERRYDHEARNALRRHIRPTDVFLVAHAKSGNNWLAYMLAILAYRDAQARINLKNIRLYVPFIRTYAIGDIAKFSHLPDPRILRSEVPVHEELYPKILYLVRDPRAVLVSYYHTCRVLLNDPRMTPEGFVREYLARGYIERVGRQVRWDRHVLTWFRCARRDKRIMIVRYEDMVANRQAVLARAATFAGISYGPAELAAAVDRSSFEAMRKTEEEYGAALYTEEQARRGKFIRRGKIDGWKEEFPPEVIAKIDATFARAMAVAGYAASSL
jgi:hypothetical protein